ncbi:MAG: helix-turn-helix domain-containing protein [Acidobacteriia bacterium]|nr:helix-turn-helix domain-containing protein [Terriglobia bacterium]
MRACTWAECKEIPAIKIGRQWRFRREDLVQWG